MDPAGASLVWSTYLGSGSVDALAVDTAGNVYATGVAITVNTPSAGGPVGVLKLAAGNSVLDLPANSIVNAASFVPGLPLVGGLASVFLRGLNLSGTVIGSGSPLPTELAGVSILVAGVAAPILAVAPVASGMEQINFQVPFEAQSNAVEIRYQGSSVVAFPQYAPSGIFILGDGTPAIEHAADYSLVTPSNPAHPGEAIIVYATGLGRVTPGWSFRNSGDRARFSGVRFRGRRDKRGPARSDSLCRADAGFRRFISGKYSVAAKPFRRNDPILTRPRRVRRVSAFSHEQHSRPAAGLIGCMAAPMFPSLAC